MSKAEFETKDKNLRFQLGELREQIYQIESQRQKLRDEYYAANALTIGQAVIYRWKPANAYNTVPHTLDGQLCHIYEVREWSDGMQYSIRKAKKDGTPAQAGKTAWGIKEDQLEVVKTAVVDRSNEGDHEDASVTVTLPCGHFEKFWLMGLADEEYIKRTEELKALEVAE